MELTSYAETVGNFTDEYMKNIKLVEYEDIATAKLWNETILISQTLWETSKRTISAFDNQYAIHTRYGWSAYGFWGGLLFLGMANRLISFVVESRIGRKARDIESTTRSDSPVVTRSKLTSSVADNYSYSMQLQRYIADRTGTIAYANLPVLWMFSGRNNVFLWATGWSFSTFNIFHRHVARIATIQAIVHSVAYSILQSNFGPLQESWKREFWFMGGMAK
ncbi:hypothetical protein VE03_07833 [Pseudogymnoascus sp. 23342-1-I1]|nr:hypothetical protein VE03_07833 [Pseudogymnoascus sp. 23342-1-I1]